MITLVLAIIMNAELPLFSLKLKNFSIKNNWIEILFILITILSLILLKFVAIPLAIVLYILLSLIKKNA